MSPMDDVVMELLFMVDNGRCVCVGMGGAR